MSEWAEKCISMETEYTTDYVKSLATSISDEKKYAYLEDEKAIKRVQKKAAGKPTIKDDIPHPTSFYELKNAIENLIKTVKNFSV